jgi:hypothetical protein
MGPALRSGLFILLLILSLQPYNAEGNRAQISGTVRTADRVPQPLEDALVKLTNPTTGQEFSSLSDRQGHFLFTGLPSGKFILTARKAGYLLTAFGSMRPGGPGVALVLTEDATVRDITVDIPPAATIGGTVRDSRGTPVSSIAVSVLRVVRRDQSKGFVDVSGIEPAITDSQGHYLLSGLAPGTYIVRASMPTIDGNVHQTSPDEVTLARRLLSPGAYATQSIGSSSVTPNTGEALASVPIYYPRTPLLLDASPLTVDLGAVLSAIDLEARLVPVFRIGGMVLDSSGQPMNTFSISIRPSTPTGKDPSVGLRTYSSGTIEGVGRFLADRLLPGEYVVQARGIVSPDGRQTNGARAVTEQIQGSAKLVVSLERTDATELVLPLRPGTQVSGRIEINGPVKIDPSGLTLRLLEAGIERSTIAPVATAGKNGYFSFGAVPAGHYWLVPENSKGLALRAIAGLPGDPSEIPIEVPASGQVDTLIVQFVPSLATLGGIVIDSDDRPFSSLFVAVFPCQIPAWLSHSRRIRAVRPDANGTYSFSDLPAGDYCLIALADLDDGQLFDPAFLAQVSRSALQITLTDGKRSVQDLRTIR